MSINKTGMMKKEYLGYFIGSLIIISAMTFLGSPFIGFALALLAIIVD